MSKKQLKKHTSVRDKDRVHQMNVIAVMRGVVEELALHPEALEIAALAGIDYKDLISQIVTQRMYPELTPTP